MRPRTRRYMKEPGQWRRVAIKWSGVPTESRLTGTQLCGGVEPRLARQVRDKTRGDETKRELVQLPRGNQAR